jgi:hypothetical protein
VRIDNFFTELKRRNRYKQRNFFAGRGLHDDPRCKTLLAKLGLPATS